jgi:Na+/H+ antiporter NhaC
MIKERISLWWIWYLSLAGVIFSATLSYIELTTGACAIGAGCTKLASLPSCVYGCAMFALILIIASMGLSADSAKKAKRAGKPRKRR